MSEYSNALTKRILGWTAFILFLVVLLGFSLSSAYLHLPDFLKMEHKQYKIFLDWPLFKQKQTYVTGAIATVFSVVMYLVFNPTSSGKRKRILNSRSGAVNTNLENSRWMTDKERDEYFPPAKFNSLRKLKKDGIPVRAVFKNGDVHLNIASPMHCLIIGATGSGKTTTFINPMIQMIGHAASGSSMIVTDPKGELFQMHSKFLKEKGYDCMVLDLRDAYSSFRWNPLDSIYDLYQKYVDEGKVLYKRRDKAENSGLKLMNKPEEYGEVWHEYNDKAYANVDELIVEIKIAKQKFFDEAYEDLNDLCSVLCPVESKDDPVWEKGAKSMVLSILLAMLEDSEDPELNFTKEKFCFFNVNKALSNSDNNFEELKRFFCGRNPLSKAVTLSKQVLSAAETTLASYMSIAFDKMSMFNDEGLCALTSATDIDPSQIATKPTALFLKIPDEKDTRHPLAAVFVLSIYKALIKIASAREDLSLPRNVYMILDEFGNMPKIDKFDKMVTVGRSRKIWFSMVVQSYAQLENVYSKTIADIIKSNCGIKMFIGSNDIETCKEFSELCGNMTVQTASVSSGTGDKGGDVSVSQQVQTRALIYPSELQKLNNQESTGNSIIVTFGNYPLKTKFTPSYMCSLYEFGAMDIAEQKTNAFFGDKVYYHLPTRNQILETRMKAQEEEKNTKEGTDAQGDGGEGDTGGVGSDAGAAATDDGDTGAEAFDVNAQETLQNTDANTQDEVAANTTVSGDTQNAVDVPANKGEYTDLPEFNSEEMPKNESTNDKQDSNDASEENKQADSDAAQDNDQEQGQAAG